MLIASFLRYTHTRPCFFAAVFLGGNAALLGYALYKATHRSVKAQPLHSPVDSTMSAPPPPPSTSASDWIVPHSTAPEHPSSSSSSFASSRTTSATTPTTPSVEEYYRGTDDTLPSPPLATRGTATTPMEGWHAHWLGQASPHDAVSQRWMLQDTLIEDEDEERRVDDEERETRSVGDGEQKTVSEPSPSTNSENKLRFKPDIQPHVEVDGDRVGSCADSHDNFLPETLETTGYCLPALSTSSTHQRTSVDSAASHSHAFLSPLSVPAARSHRPVVLVSPAPLDDGDASTPANSPVPSPSRPPTAMNASVFSCSRDRGSSHEHHSAPLGPSLSSTGNAEDVERCRRERHLSSSHLRHPSVDEASPAARLHPSAANYRGERPAAHLPSPPALLSYDGSVRALISPSRERTPSILKDVPATPKAREETEDKQTRRSPSPGNTHLNTVHTPSGINPMVQRLRLQLNQAERAAELQRALHENAETELEDLRHQLEDLLSIQAELERRSHVQEVAMVEAEQRHAAAVTTLEAATKRELALVTSEYKVKLASQEAAQVEVRSELRGRSAEVTALRTELAAVQEELRASLEVQLTGENKLRNAMAAQAEVERRCALLTSQLEELTMKHDRLTDTHTGTVDEWMSAIRAAEERAAVAQLAFQALCKQLSSGCSPSNPPASPNISSVHALSSKADVSRSSVEVDGATGDSTVAAVRLTSPATQTQSTDNGTSALAAVAEAAVVDAVKAALAQLHVDARSRKSNSGAAGRESIPTDDCASAYVLSDAGRSTLATQQEIMQEALARVADGYRRVAREAKAATDSQAAEIERVLSAELKQLRAQLEVQRDKEAYLTRLRQESVHRQELQSTHDIVLPSSLSPSSDSARRQSVGVNTDAVNNTPATPSHDDARASTALHELLLEAHRELQQQRHHARDLEEELLILREGERTAATLADVQGTLRQLRLAFHQSVREAVRSVQSTMHAWRVGARARRGIREPHRVDARSRGGRAPAGQWRHVVQYDADEYAELDAEKEDDDNVEPQTQPSASSRRRTLAPADLEADLSDTWTPLSRVGEVDDVFLRLVQRAILQAEVHVERVGDELLGVRRREGGGDGTAVQWHESVTVASTNRAGATAAASSFPPYVDPLRHHRSGSLNATPTTSAPQPPSPQMCTERQQRLYAEMRGLLSRSQAEEKEAVTPIRQPPRDTAALHASRYSPNGSRWLANIRPPPLLASAVESRCGLPTTATTASVQQSTSSSSAYARQYGSIRSGTEDHSKASAINGMYATPPLQQEPHHQPSHHLDSPLPRAATPSPYVRAYVSAQDDMNRSEAAPLTTRQDAAKRVGVTPAVALHLYEGMHSTTQELRRVGQLLETTHDLAVQLAAQQYTCLQQWQADVMGVIDDALDKLESAVERLASTGVPSLLPARFVRLPADARTPSHHAAGVTETDNAPTPMSRSPVLLADVLAGRRQ